MFLQGKLDVVIPLWNEEKNVETLVEEVSSIWDFSLGFNKLYLINNGSIDNTGQIIDTLKSRYSFVDVVQLQMNLNYGGGIYEGFKHTRAQYVGYIPGDLQVSSQDLLKVWLQLIVEKQDKGEAPLFYKGCRTIRHDKFSTRFVSFVYTKIVKFILGLNVSDINGLPKIFDRLLLDLLPEERMLNFVFDSQLMAVANWSGWKIKEVPVEFHARREGVSSWSGKRFRTYFESFKKVIRVRMLKACKPVKINLKAH